MQNIICFFPSNSSFADQVSHDIATELINLSAWLCLTIRLLHEQLQLYIVLALLARLVDFRLSGRLYGVVVATLVVLDENWVIVLVHIFIDHRVEWENNSASVLQQYLALIIRSLCWFHWGFIAQTQVAEAAHVAF